MSEEGKVSLPNLEDGGVPADVPIAPEPEGPMTRIAADLEAVFDVPVQVSAVLGRARMDQFGELRSPFLASNHHHRRILRQRAHRRVQPRRGAGPHRPARRVQQRR